ncbi:hypothetical protein ACH4UR_35745 [Streptomyces lydicus]|uniref:hypothetical protein n=1 Tax=Streptomyces lydicus TaxID=47763 RepID=UPI0033F0C3C0
MGAVESSGPAFTQVRLTGPPDEVGPLMAALGSVAEFIFGPVSSEPDARGEVSCTARVVTHPSGPAPQTAQPRLLTVQTTLEVDAGAGLGLEESVADALGSLAGVRQARSRVIADVALPTRQD